MFSLLQFQINGKQCGVTPSQDSDTLYLGNICKTWKKEAVSFSPGLFLLPLTPELCLLVLFFLPPSRHEILTVNATSGAS